MSATKTRGSSNIGARHGRAKINEHLVLEIRRAWEQTPKPRMTDIAKQYGVKTSTVSRIVNYRDWRHVLPDGRILPFMIEREDMVEYLRALDVGTCDLWHAVTDACKNAPSRTVWRVDLAEVLCPELPKPHYRS